ncbi:MAG: hypothetical protein FWH44_06400 [Methanomassiliicoccaceae archaeon]|nr:hypothetical protein [Methanomassiliicoccaceae archaeon]
MAVWLCRAGLRGEYENKFIDTKSIYLIRSVSINLTGKTDMQELMKLISSTYPTEPDGSVVTMSSQARAFATKVKVGDWVIVPSMGPDRLLFIGEITGDYEYDGKKSELKHSHTVDWKYGAWERSAFDDDIVRTVDAFDTFMLFFKMRQDRRIRDIVRMGTPFSSLPMPKRITINKPENEPLEETEFVAEDSAEVKEVIAEVREAITEVKKSNIAEAAAVRKVLEEVKDIIAEVRETITEVKKATITEAIEVKKVIAEVRDAIDDAAGAGGNNIVYADSGHGWNKGVVCCRCDPTYYDILKTRRCFRR